MPTPIIGRVATPQQVKAFRTQKLQLKDQGYPARETHQFVGEWMKKVEDRWERVIGADTLLVAVPSGSGTNMITIHFAFELQRRFGATLLEGGFLSKSHHTEAKNALTLEKRNRDPVGFRVSDADLLREKAKKFRRVIIVDDLIGTGESSVKLRKVLEAEGIKIDSLINLVTVEHRYPTPRHMDRLAGKIESIASFGEQERWQLRRDIEDVFGDYTRQKLNRVEREIRNPLTAIRALESIRKAAVLERQLGRSNQRDIPLSL